MNNYKKYSDIANTLRIDIIKMLEKSKSGHPGGSLSACEILTALYFKEMNIDPTNPKKDDRDRFVLSKGHGAPVLYAALAEKGYFPKEELSSLRKIDSMLQGHPDMKGTPGVDMTTGSLGQGLSAANGMALASKLDNKGYRVYALLGDGEVQEGIIWEAAMFAAHYKLDNLTVFIDHNGLQIDGRNKDVMNIEPIDEKFKAFGWHTISIDGHDFQEIFNAIDEAKKVEGKPTIIIAKTIKGKGVSFMENQVGWHGNAPSKEEAEKAIKELGGGIND
ncbi:transketolase [Anaerosalibacter massiliensis]|uniref:transketolase n=1 Tax=Anaerosalibacter massiliensis TaxID=1347392 RepID=UPI00094654CC|nr:transketolase [Anaerosalibacter massiliensis]